MRTLIGNDYSLFAIHLDIIITMPESKPLINQHFYIKSLVYKNSDLKEDVNTVKLNEAMPVMPN